MALAGLLGYRDDVKIEDYWWHRLIKVAYGLAASFATIGLLTLLVSEASPVPESRNVRITGRLEESVASAGPYENGVSKFLALNGRIGVVRRDGSLYELHSFSFDDSICVSNAFRDADQVAAFFDSRDRTPRRGTWTGDAIRKMNAIEADNTAPMCFLGAGLRSSIEPDHWSSVVKWEFLRSAEIQAMAETAAYTVVALLFLHIVLANFYYRGVLYVVLGPRTRPAAASAVDGPNQSGI